MALAYSTLRKPVNSQVVDPSTGQMREEWVLYFGQLTQMLNASVGELSGAVAPADGGYIVDAASSALSAERVATDTATVDVDMGTANQAKWNVLEVPGIAATGLVARTASATYAARTLTAPAAGISVSNGGGVAGNPTLSLANDLAALEGLGSTGLAARTGTDTWAQRTITAGSGVSVSNGDGVAGNPTISADSLIAIIEDQKAQNSAGGTFTSGADQIRVLNTLVYNRDSTVSLGTNQFTLPAGSWVIEWSAPSRNVGPNQSFLYNATGTVEVARGTSEDQTTTNAATISVGSARVTPAGSTAYEIRHRCTTTRATNGFGALANFGTEVYTRVTIRRG